MKILRYLFAVGVVIGAVVLVVSFMANNEGVVVATLAPPIDISKLHVTKITQVDFQGCSVSIAIAPDSDHYVCSFGGVASGLWLGSLSRGLEKKLTDEGGPALWLPNGKQIVYAEIVPDHPTMLYELDIEAVTRTPISTTTMPFGGDHFQVLPDGRVLFLARGALQIWDSRTRTLKPFQKLGCIDLQMTPKATVYSYYTTVSPDGQHLADVCAGALYLIDIGTGKVITLTNGIEFATRQIEWSPDGRTLAYSFAPTDTRRAELWLVNADATNPRRLWRDEFARAFHFLTWMPDGQTLLFINDPGGTSFEVGWTFMAISAKGGSPKALFTYGEGLALFDNGRKILILRSVRESNLPEGDFIVELSH